MNDLLTRSEYERLLERELALDVLDLIEERTAQRERMLARWDTHHAGDCRCPAGEPHGVRLSTEDWDDHAQQEEDDQRAYQTFSGEAASRGLL